jgi:hypothetical protein
MIQNKMLIQIPLIEGRFPTPGVRTWYFQVPIHLWVLLLKVIDQRLVIGAETCLAEIALHIGRMIAPKVLQQCFSIYEYLAAILSVANYFRHVDVSQMA